MEEIIVVGINGSPFKEGNVATILGQVLAGAAEPGVSTKMIHLEEIPHHHGRREEDCPFRERISRLPQEGNLPLVVSEILEADGVIFATPVHCFNMSSRLLALLSWLSTATDAPDYALKGKVAACISVCEEDGAQGANEKMISMLLHLGFIMPPFCSYFFNKHSAALSEGLWQEGDLVTIARNVIQMIKLVEGIYWE